MTKGILFEQLPPELFDLFKEMTMEIKELRRMIEEGEIGLAISEAEWNLALGRITKLEEDLVVVQEQLTNFGVSPEEIKNVITSLQTVNEKIGSLESYDTNNSSTITATMNRLSTIEMNQINIGMKKLTLPVTVVDNLTLPLEDENMNTISWTSNEEDIISSTGIVTRPSATVGDKQVVLTATFTFGANSAEKQFTVTVKALERTDEEKLAIALQGFDATIFKGEVDEFGVIKVTESQTLPTEREGATITWDSSNQGAITLDGTVIRSADSDEAVTLTATVVLGGASEQVMFNLLVLKEEPIIPEPEPTPEPKPEPELPDGDGGLPPVVTDPDGTEDDEGELIPDPDLGGDDGLTEPEEPVGGAEPVEPVEPEEPVEQDPPLVVDPPAVDEGEIPADDELKEDDLPAEEEELPPALEDGMTEKEEETVDETASTSEYK